ncbi:hypothetical protein KIPB_000991 [Kipferlia bialata]|uniref:Uncharacterized protein n=1 Tax=Kipferlia bialata TaxID=797122 RepID=A0A9K3CQ32_9EUKA|nr:hypothetical protein KIPB_000991 [Kipferlia bialata]|eukprot:g991.t1
MMTTQPAPAPMAHRGGVVSSVQMDTVQEVPDNTPAKDLPQVQHLTQLESTINTTEQLSATVHVQNQGLTRKGEELSSLIDGIETSLSSLESRSLLSQERCKDLEQRLTDMRACTGVVHHRLTATAKPAAPAATTTGGFGFGASTYTAPTAAPAAASLSLSRDEVHAVCSLVGESVSDRLGRVRLDLATLEGRVGRGGAHPEAADPRSPATICDSASIARVMEAQTDAVCVIAGRLARQEEMHGGRR